MKTISGIRAEKQLGKEKGIINTRQFKTYMAVDDIVTVVLAQLRESVQHCGSKCLVSIVPSPRTPAPHTTHATLFIHTNEKIN